MARIYIDAGLKTKYQNITAHLTRSFVIKESLDNMSNQQSTVWNYFKNEDHLFHSLHSSQFFGGGLAGGKIRTGEQCKGREKSHTHPFLRAILPP